MGRRPLAFEALTHNAVLHYSKVLSDEAMEALIDEGARLVTGYLERKMNRGAAPSSNLQA